jgi:hypothetical protein
MLTSVSTLNVWLYYGCVLHKPSRIAEARKQAKNLVGVSEGPLWHALRVALKRNQLKSSNR